MKTKAVLILSIILVSLISCDKPHCSNTNPIFDLNGLETIVYKQELVNEMERVGNENLSYWFSNYSEQNGKEFITVDIQGNELCAKGLIQVSNWKNIEGIKKTEGVSYAGAELKGLSFKVIIDGESIHFIYKNVDHIID